MSPHSRLFAAFGTANVEYVVVGGVAVNIHGYVRATYDLDIFIRPTVDNAQLAHRTLAALGVPLEGKDWTDLLSDEDHIRFGSNGEHVDILSSIGDMPFDQVWCNRIYVEVEGLSVPFISFEDLLQNKKATGRLRDLVDVDELERVRPH